VAKRTVLRGGLLVSAIGVFYSGLMFLNLVPATLSIRFWDGGQVAMNAAAVLELACLDGPRRRIANSRTLLPSLRLSRCLIRLGTQRINPLEQLGHVP
jgi:hypothetical protein